MVCLYELDKLIFFPTVIDGLYSFNIIFPYKLTQWTTPSSINFSRMNIWFQTNSSGNRKKLGTSSISLANSSLPTITEQRKKVSDDHSDNNSEASIPQHSEYEEQTFFMKPREDNQQPDFNDINSNSFNPCKRKDSSNSISKQSEDKTPPPQSLPRKSNKSVKFMVTNPREVSALLSKQSRQSYGMGHKREEEIIEDEFNSATPGRTFYGFRPLRDEGGESAAEQTYSNIPARQRQVSSHKSPALLSNVRNSSSSGTRPAQAVTSNAETERTKTMINHRSSTNNYSLSRNYSNGFEQQGEWSALLSRRSDRPAGSVIKTTGRRNIRQHIVCLIEYCSNQVGLAIYNTVNGQIHLCQIIERLTYFRTLSTIERFYPLELVYSSSLEHTPLIRKLTARFRNVGFRGLKRMVFDETRGYQIYSQRGNREDYNPDNKFIAYAALSALVSHLENSLETKFNYASLKIRWHLLEDLLIIESQTIAELEIFLNGQTKTQQNCFVQNFSCLTHGGESMLRANLLQPLSNRKAISERHDLVAELLADNQLYETLKEEVSKFRNFELITAKFIQSPKEKNIRSLKCYLSAIYSLAHMCLLLKRFHHRVQAYLPRQLPVVSRLFALLDDFRVNELREGIESNFDSETLRGYQSGKSAKRQSFIFLFKPQRLEDDFIEVLRVTYSHTLEDILRIAKSIKEKSGFDLKLVSNEYRGYYLRSNRRISLSALSDRIEDDVIQISERGECVLFSTSMLVSLSNRLKESEKKLILLSEGLLRSIIEDVQKSIEVLFDINYELSVLDMVLAFAGFVRKYPVVQFTRPVLVEEEIVEVEGLKTVWTKESKFRISEGANLRVGLGNKVLIFQKTPNSFDQLNLLYSMGYLTILAQIGCFVPASKLVTGLFTTLMSKIHLSESIESNLSHFQLELHHFKAILDNSQHQNSKCLILLDQLIQGTQYEEQIALSMALLNQLCKLKGKTLALVSDRFQLNTIGRMAGVAGLMTMEAEEMGQFVAAGQFVRRERMENNERGDGNIIQIVLSEEKVMLQELMVGLNFSEDFLSGFKKLSVSSGK